MEDGEIDEGAMVVDEEEAPSAPQQPKTEKSAHELLRESKASVEDVVAKMLSVKKEGHPKSLLRELVTQMFLHFITLRQANRSILLEEDRVKAETESAKAPVDFTTLQLHNLMYEKSHYVKAIKACKDFRSKYPDIDLVSEEEFFHDAPEEIKGKTLSNDSAHNLMMQRLQFELFQRKELCKLQEKLELQKKKLSDTIANRKKFLSSLPSHLKSLKKASLPVQNQLGILHTKKIKQHHLAELLPPPLYVIYSEFLAQKEAFGENIDLEIVGSVKDAQGFARQQANKDTGISTSVENSRLEDDAPDEEDDGQRRRKRPKRVPSKESLDQDGLYQAHPLKIILHIYDDEVSDPKSAKLITLKCEYLLKLNVVCVGIEGSHDGAENNILCNLFPDDTGLELPHQSAKLCVGDALTFDERRISRPYKWAQHLAGIDFLPEVSPLLISHGTQSGETARSDAVVSGLSLYRQQYRVQTVVQRIRSRKKAQLALVAQLDLLMKLKWPALSCESVPWALHNPLCNLHGWSPVGPPPIPALSLPIIDTEQVRESIDADTIEQPGSSKEELESTREDGELPSLVPAAFVNTDVRLNRSKGSNLDHSRQLTLISKSLVSPISIDQDVPAYIEPEVENTAYTQYYEMDKKSWVDYGVREYCLVLTKNTDTDKSLWKLEAKIKISMEYPLRPPHFALSLHSKSSGGNHSESDGSEWYNELCAIEAEVNLHILKMLPVDQENYIYLINGRLLARSFRGRDRRKMISWKDMECTHGYPY
ncbi:hypothetical protein SLA2020_360380 [Shorea laevis]